MVTKVLFLTFMSMCMGIGICMGMGTEPPSEPFQGTFEQSKHSIAPVRLILHGRGTFEYYSEYGGLSYKGIWQRVGDDAIRLIPLDTSIIDLITFKRQSISDTVRIISSDMLRLTHYDYSPPVVRDYHRVEE